MQDGPDTTDTRRAILEVAKALLAEHGDTAAVRIDAIVDRAGVARGTLYRYFPSKASIFAALAEEAGVTVPAEGPSTRERILDAAADLVLRTGFAATTMEQIAERAGVRPPTIYRHFASKEELLIALAERAGLLEEIRAALAHGAAGDPATDLRALGRMLLIDQAERFAVLAVCIAEGPAHPAVGGEVMRRLVLPVWRTVGDYLEAQVAAGRLEPGPTLPRVYALAGVAVAFALARRMFGEFMPFSAEELAETVLTTFLHGAATPAYREELAGRGVDGSGQAVDLGHPP
ncbi:MAG: TetR/AcrR family transcriptional regulator [Thermomicrobiales bacterium]